MDDLKVHMGQLKMKTNVAKKVKEVKEEFAREEEERSLEKADGAKGAQESEGAEGDKGLNIGAPSGRTNWSVSLPPGRG